MSIPVQSHHVERHSHRRDEPVYSQVSDSTGAAHRAVWLKVVLVVSGIVIGSAIIQALIFHI